MHDLCNWFSWGEQGELLLLGRGEAARVRLVIRQHAGWLWLSACLVKCRGVSHMKRKLDHGSEVRSFSLGKKPCKVSEYTSTTGLVPCSATPTTFGDLRAANGQGQQRRRITSVQPPSGLQEWLKMFQSWSGPEKLLALDELIDSCEPTQVKHMMQVIEPQFQRDFISLLPKELALYVLSFLEPRDLLQAAQTCRYWRILAEDNLLWREKCKEEGIDEPLHIKRRKVIKPGFIHSPWKSAYIRQHRIDTNWRRGELKSPKVLKGHDDHVITCLQFCGNRIVSGSDDNTLKVWSAVTGKCLRTLVGHTGGVWSSQMRDNIIISGSTDRTLKVWNAETGECIHTLYGHTSTVRCMHLHEKRVVSGSRDATLRVWDIETGQCLHVLMGHVAAVRCVQYDGRRVFDGIHVVSGSLDTSIRVWDVETGNCIHTLTGHQSLTSGMELKDNILVSGNADSTVKIWDIKTGQCLQTLQGPNKHQSAVTCLQFNKNFVITSSDDGTVKLWDLKTGEFIRNLVTLESGGSGGVVWRIRASNTKLVCAVGSRNGTEETKLLVLDFDVDMKSAAFPIEHSAALETTNRIPSGILNLEQLSRSTHQALKPLEEYPCSFSWCCMEKQEAAGGAETSYAAQKMFNICGRRDLFHLQSYFMVVPPSTALSNSAFQYTAPSPITTANKAALYPVNALLGFPTAGQHCKEDLRRITNSCRKRTQYPPKRTQRPPQKGTMKRREPRSLPLDIALLLSHFILLPLNTLPSTTTNIVRGESLLHPSHPWPAAAITQPSLTARDLPCPHSTAIRFHKKKLLLSRSWEADVVAAAPIFLGDDDGGPSRLYFFPTPTIATKARCLTLILGYKRLWERATLGASPTSPARQLAHFTKFLQKVFMMKTEDRDDREEIEENEGRQLLYCEVCSESIEGQDRKPAYKSGFASHDEGKSISGNAEQGQGCNAVPSLSSGKNPYPSGSNAAPAQTI
ncbi:hypothetical protein IHE44_0013161 [Lamprotornis superbus]|uniref:F-box domain-containing protein n=90 Tax=Amniota TaxID=32524 RepID=A0A835NH40_9PASS|nr:hypothetical protein IHE44_0013161 [Lamprotornis superbus]